MSLAPGTRIGPYEIVSMIGAGGMGEVYRATDTRLHRVVAIKILSTRLDETGLRLLQEARAASALNHPHICTVHEVVEADGQAFIVMEYVDGMPLSEMIAKQPLAVETAIRLGIQVADALAHAHERGIVHRDLKPSNVVITRDGRAKVIDFGLAVRDGDGLTDQISTRTSVGESGDLAGTLSYMAPEVLKGQSSGVPSDIWALGVTLYAMISGALPFRGRTAFELTAAIQYEPAQPLPTRGPGGVRTIVMRCLTKELDQFHRASEIRAALETIQLDDTRVSLPRPTRAHKPVAAAIVLVLVSFGVGAAIWMLPRVDRRHPPPTPRDVVSVLIVDFKNDTGDRAFDGTIQEMLASSIEDSSFLVIHPRPPASRQPLDESAGRALAVREGITAMVSGNVALTQPGYVISATITDPALGKILARVSANALARVNIVDAAESVAREIRIRLGDSAVPLNTEAPPGRGSFEAVAEPDGRSRTGVIRQLGGGFSLLTACGRGGSAIRPRLSAVMEVFGWTRSGRPSGSNWLKVGVGCELHARTRAISNTRDVLLNES